MALRWDSASRRTSATGWWEARPKNSCFPRAAISATTGCSRAWRSWTTRRCESSSSMRGGWSYRRASPWRTRRLHRHTHLRSAERRQDEEGRAVHEVVVVAGAHPHQAQAETVKPVLCVFGRGAHSHVFDNLHGDAAIGKAVIHLHLARAVRPSPQAHAVMPAGGEPVWIHQFHSHSAMRPEVAHRGGECLILGKDA